MLVVKAVRTDAMCVGAWGESCVQLLYTWDTVCGYGVDECYARGLWVWILMVCVCQSCVHECAGCAGQISRPLEESEDSFCILTTRLAPST